MPEIQEVEINNSRMMIMMMLLDGANPRERFSMLCLALSIFYRERATFSNDPKISGMTADEFTELVKRQIRMLIDKPPTQYEDLSLEQECNCPACSAERRAHAH